jgi:mannose-6-phosphate isomerase|tara:strand:+ start:1353 stop:1721 length:369 start_codon:yes stop_codon:yes gene_type:complete
MNNETKGVKPIIYHFRPWGNYEVLLDSDVTKVKRITINPHKRLSYQYHHKREERWVCVEGVLTLILDGKEIQLQYGDEIHIPLGAKHRGWNNTDSKVVFIEIQTGTYFGEDDIVRIEDDWNR